MLFNSHVFIFGFLPLVVLVFHALGRAEGSHLARGWLVLASLFFYGWWNPVYLPLILTSIAFNFGIGRLTARTSWPHWKRRLALSIGIAGNLGALGYFKYAHFFATNVRQIEGAAFELAPIVLPLAISFFTFQQIAYLVDAHRTGSAQRNLLDYALFVTFFPQLIAGPIVHHGEMLPQFADGKIGRVRVLDLEVGLSTFFIGLFKKVVLADGVARYATPVFAAVSAGARPDAHAAWGAALAYSFQIYFDFSGYSDMAIGLGRLFGVRLPLNFDSPYRATNIIEFWRRWHMTLSRFLRDYLYIPLGGNRRGPIRRYVNLMITMLLGGLWHGAGWTFVVWGGLHGLYLLANHAWRLFTDRALPRRVPAVQVATTGFARVLTFLAVVVGWVFFRAETTGDAFALLSAMAGSNGFAWPSGAGEEFGTLALLLAFVWWAPNTQTLMAEFRIALTESRDVGPAPARLRWRPTRGWAFAMAILTVWGLLGINQYSEFLYFQF